MASKVTTPCPGNVLEAARIWLGELFFSCPVLRSMACSLQGATGSDPNKGVKGLVNGRARPVALQLLGNVKGDKALP